jgi:hypothetical protein
MVRFFNFCRWLLALFGLVLFITLAVALYIPTWHEHLVHLLWQSASRTLTATSHTWLAFLAFWVVAPILIWIGIIIYKLRGLYRRQAVSPMKTAFLKSTSALEMIPLSVIAGVWLVIFGVFIVHTIYHEHQDATGAWQDVVKEKNRLKQGLGDRDQYIGRLELAQRDNQKGDQASAAAGQQAQQTIQNLQSSVQQLQQKNQQLSADLEDRKKNIHPDEPAFGHLRSLFNFFSNFRNTIGATTQCAIEISVPRDGGSSVPIFAQFFDVGSLAGKCEIYTPREENPADQGMENPDVEKAIINGMQDGFIVVHIARENVQTPWGKNFYWSLSQILPVKLSYENMPKARLKRDRMDNPTAPLVWLQFGKDVHWIQ